MNKLLTLTLLLVVLGMTGCSESSENKSWVIKTKSFGKVITYDREEYLTAETEQDYPKEKPINYYHEYQNKRGDI